MAKKKWQDDVRESAQKIWLAGLGALAVAEDEGSKLFKNLVKEGERFESAGKETVKSSYGGAKRGLDEAAERTRRTAGEAWSKVEEGLDDRLAKTLHRIGVPTRDEIAALSRRVEELTGALERMRQKETGTAASPRPPATARAGARARVAAAKPPAKAARPATAKPPQGKPRPAGAKSAAARPIKPTAAKPAAPRRPPVTRPASAAAPPLPAKITTPGDVTTTADVKTPPVTDAKPSSR